MAQRYDENRDLLQIQVGELENQIRELAGAMQHRDQRIVELEALAANQQMGAAAAVQQNNSVESALRALQTPQIIRVLQPFDGNPIKLHSFIKSIDDLMPEIERVRNTPAYTVWLLAIRSKIIGDADSVLEFSGTSSDWSEIKSNLITHYSDKRDEVTLTKDLFKMTQKDKPIEEFYKEIQFCLSLMVNQLNLNESNIDIRNAKNHFFQEMGLKVFLAGLNEPIGQIIRAQCPSSLKDALRRCLEERNYHHQKPKYNPPPPPSSRKFQYPNNPFLPGPRPQPLPRIPFQPNPSTPHPFPRAPQYANSNPFYRTQHPFQQFPPQRTLPPNPPFRAQPLNPFQQTHPFSHQNNPPKPNSGSFRHQKPSPMEVDQSLKSLKVNYMNRPNWHEVFYTEPMDYYGQFGDPYSFYQYEPNDYYNDLPVNDQDKFDNNTEQQDTSEPESDTLNFHMESPKTADT